MNTQRNQVDPHPVMRIAHQLPTFPEQALLDLGFNYAGKDWGNYNQIFWDIDCTVGQVYVVDFKEVWLCVGHGLRQLEKVRTVADLEQLIALL